MQKTILVPFDGSPLAERALPYVKRLASGSNCRVVLIEALSIEAAPRDDPTSTIWQAKGEVDDYLDEVAKTFGPGIPVERLVSHDDPASAILHEINARTIDLVVMSTHGRTGFGRVVFGSVADRVLREAGVPILLIPQHASHDWASDRPLRILVPLDLSELSKTALSSVEAIEGIAGKVELSMLSVIEPIPPVVIDPMVYAAIDVEGDQANARRRLESIREKIGGQFKKVRVDAVIGPVIQTILALASEQNADVIAIATHGRSGLTRLVMGSVATGLIQSATTPILVTHPLASMPAAADHDVASTLAS
jgi:nucleotide-binding universal stress UspA family protein